MKRLPELDRLVQSAYEDKVMGRVPENLCVQLLNGYEVELDTQVFRTRPHDLIPVSDCTSLSSSGRASRYLTARKQAAGKTLAPHISEVANLSAADPDPGHAPPSRPKAMPTSRCRAYRGIAFRK